MVKATRVHSTPPLNTLQEAASVLDELAAGVQPDRARLIAAAMALDTLTKTTTPSRDVLDAAAGLEILATGGTLDLDEIGRSRARQFAEVVRQLMAAPVHDATAPAVEPAESNDLPIIRLPAASPDAYAAIMNGDDMVPTYRPGTVVYVHPHLTPRVGFGCVLRNEAGDLALIREYLGQTPEHWHLRQRNPLQDTVVDKRRWPICHMIVGNHLIY
jgi:Peptidase S24-like